VDFILVRKRDQVDAIECKWNPSDFDPSALRVFRSYYPNGENYLVSPLSGAAYLRRFGHLTVKVCDPSKLE
jgi:hypothetical protein